MNQIELAKVGGGVHQHRYDCNANGKNPRGLRVRTEYVDEFTASVGTYAFGPDDINGFDCFHPSRLGQNQIAEGMWTRSPVR